MRRILPWLPILLTACSSNLVGPETLGGPLGRFGHSLTREPALEAPPPAPTAPGTLTTRLDPTPNPRALVATPFPATPPPAPTPSPTPPVPTPSPTPPVIVLLTPAPTPTPSPAAVFDMGSLSVNQRLVTVWVRDDGTQDGDRVRIALNGTLLREDLYLTNDWIPLSVELKSGANYIRWTALNEGEVSPNTFEVYLDPGVLTQGSTPRKSSLLLTGQSDLLTIQAP